MRWLLALSLAFASSAACSTGGPAEVRAPREAVGWVVASRGLLVARLDDEISTSETKPGQPFRATLVAPFRDATGTIRIAPGAALVGRVVDIRRGQGARPALIQLRFDELVVGRGGRGGRYRLDAPVTAADVEQGAPEIDKTPIRAGVLGGILVGATLGYGGASVLLGAGVGSLGGLARAAQQRVVDARVPVRSFVTAHVHAIARE